MAVPLPFIYGQITSAHTTYILLSVHSLTSYFLLFDYVHLSNHNAILFA